MHIYESKRRNRSRTMLRFRYGAFLRQRGAPFHGKLLSMQYHYRWSLGKPLPFDVTRHRARESAEYEYCSTTGNEINTLNFDGASRDRCRFSACGFRAAALVATDTRHVKIHGTRWPGIYTPGTRSTQLLEQRFPNFSISSYNRRLYLLINEL